MKQLLVRLPDELHARLDEQPNKSEFVRKAIEDALIGEGDTDCLTEQRVREIVKEELNNKPLDVAALGLKPASSLQSASTFIPRPPDPNTGYPCCEKNSPCKHWQWNEVEAMWINSLTGKMREA